MELTAHANAFHFKVMVAQRTGMLLMEESDAFRCRIKKKPFNRFY